MLNHEDNEFITRVGPGTPVGTLMRQYWVPAAPLVGTPESRLRSGFGSCFSGNNFHRFP